MISAVTPHPDGPGTSKCGRCQHIFPLNAGKPYECPVCGATVPECHTIYPLWDHLGNMIHPSIVPKLQEMGLLSSTPTRDQFIDMIQPSLDHFRKQL